MVRRPVQFLPLSNSIGQMFVFRQFSMLLSDLVSTKIRRSSDGSKADAICFTVNLRLSDVCNEAILECYCPILFFLKYDGPVMVWGPTQFVSLSITVGQMFAMKQFWNVIVRSYSFNNTTVQWWFADQCNFSHCQIPSVRCLKWVSCKMLVPDTISTLIWRS